MHLVRIGIFRAKDSTGGSNFFLRIAGVHAESVAGGLLLKMFEKAALRWKLGARVPSNHELTRRKTRLVLCFRNDSDEILAHHHL